MKFLVLLFALAVFANAKRRSSIVVKTEIVENIEIQSPSATIVTELFETTFQVPAELAKEIGHIFRNVPLSLAKEMVAFKVFGDSNSNHLDSFSQYSAQAAHMFEQIWKHIDVNEIIDVVTSEILSPLWTEIIVKLGSTSGSFARDAIYFANNFGGANTQITLRQPGCPTGCYYPMPGEPCYQGHCPDGCCELD